MDYIFSPYSSIYVFSDLEKPQLTLYTHFRQRHRIRKKALCHPSQNQKLQLEATQAGYTVHPSPYNMDATTMEIIIVALAILALVIQMGFIIWFGVRRRTESMSSGTAYHAGRPCLWNEAWPNHPDHDLVLSQGQREGMRYEHTEKYTESLQQELNILDAVPVAATSHVEQWALGRTTDCNTQEIQSWIDSGSAVTLESDEAAQPPVSSMSNAGRIGHTRRRSSWLIRFDEHNPPNLEAQDREQ
jgi:hypothetical protein